MESHQDIIEQIQKSTSPSNPSPVLDFSSGSFKDDYINQLLRRLNTTSAKLRQAEQTVLSQKTLLHRLNDEVIPRLQDQVQNYRDHVKSLQEYEHKAYLTHKEHTEILEKELYYAYRDKRAYLKAWKETVLYFEDETGKKCDLYPQHRGLLL